MAETTRHGPSRRARGARIGLLLLLAAAGGFAIGSNLQFFIGHPFVPEGWSWGETQWGAFTAWAVPLVAIVLTGRAAPRMGWAILAALLLLIGRTMGAALAAVHAGIVIDGLPSVVGAAVWWVTLPFLGVVLARLTNRDGVIGDLTAAPLAAAAFLPEVPTVMGVVTEGGEVAGTLIAAIVLAGVLIIWLRPDTRTRLVALGAAVPICGALFALGAAVSQL